MTLDEAKLLKLGDRIAVLGENKRDGTPRAWRVNGKVKLWKTNPNRISVPVKWGLREYGYITESNLHLISRYNGR
jgi:hypothetical protein